MINGWKLAIAAASTAIVAGTGLTLAHAHQDSRINPNTKLVSADFDSAPLDDVLSWLSSQEPDNVISRSGADPGSTITLHVHNQSLRTTEDAIADALGGRWQRDGQTLVFQRGARVESKALIVPNAKTSLNDASPHIAQSTSGASVPEVPVQAVTAAIAEAAPAIAEIALEANAAQDGSQMNAQDRAKLAKDLQRQAEDLKKQFGPEFQQKMEEQALAMQKAFGPDFERKMKAQAEEMQRAFGPEFQKKMEAQAAQIAKQFGPEFQKKMEAQARVFEKQALKMQEKFGPEFQRKMELQAKTMAEKMAKKSSSWSAYSSNKVASSANALISSLTPAQRAKMSKVGHLKLSDLTQKQRALLGSTNGRFKLEYRTDLGHVVIQNP
jgi:hypothetical protein